MAKRGKSVCFHGAFGTEGRALQKERSMRRRASNLPGCETDPYIQPATIRGRRRFLVLTRRGSR